MENNIYRLNEKINGDDQVDIIDYTNKLADSIQKKIDDIIMSGDTNAEVVDARGEFNTLGKRLNSLDKNKVDKEEGKGLSSKDNQVVVSSATPTTGEKVWLEKEKYGNNIASWQLHDTSYGTIKNGTEITYNNTSSSTQWIPTNYITFKKGTYTFSAIGELKSNIFIQKNENDYTRYFNSTINSVTFTFTEDTPIRLNGGVTANTSFSVKIMVNEGATALPYEPYSYTPNSIKTLNSNNEYEDFITNVYSSEETICGYDADNHKPIYRKEYRLDLGSLPSSNTNLINVAGLNIFELKRFDGFIYTSTNNRFPINLYDNSSNYSVFFIGSEHYIRGRGALGSGKLSKINIIIEYTKTTD